MKKMTGFTDNVNKAVKPKLMVMKAGSKPSAPKVAMKKMMPKKMK
jgi:hypothetical protein